MTALLLAYLVYYHQAFQFYAIPFMGVPELSSLPLAFVDLFKQFPSVRGRFPMTNELVRNVFAATFLALRGFYWPYCAIAFWRTTLAAIDAGTVPFSDTVTNIFLGSNVFMTLLQWYWSSIILKAIVQKLTGDPRFKEA